MATETEQQLEHERQQFQQHLAELQAQVLQAPAAQRAAVVELAQHEADGLPEPDEITALIRERLQTAMEEMDSLSALLEGEELEGEEIEV
jgi:hypothetical protein